MIKLINILLLVTNAIFLTSMAVAQTATETKRYPQFENKEVKVWKSVITPHAPLPLHRHDHPRVLIALNDGTINIVEEDGRSETHQWKAGQAYWLPANPPGTQHTDENIGTDPIEVIVVELKSVASQ